MSLPPESVVFATATVPTTMVGSDDQEDGDDSAASVSSHHRVLQPTSSSTPPTPRMTERQAYPDQYSERVDQDSEPSGNSSPNLDSMPTGPDSPSGLSLSPRPSGGLQGEAGLDPARDDESAVSMSWSSPGFPSLIPTSPYNVDIQTTNSSESGRTIRPHGEPRDSNPFLHFSLAQRPHSSASVPQSSAPIHPSSRNDGLRPTHPSSSAHQASIATGLVPSGGLSDAHAHERTFAALHNSDPAPDFAPRNATPFAAETPGFPLPNLCDLALMLNADPGLDAWWQAVLLITTTHYHAERVTLAVPADATDVYNVPWGLLATFDINRFNVSPDTSHVPDSPHRSHTSFRHSCHTDPPRDGATVTSEVHHEVTDPGTLPHTAAVSILASRPHSSPPPLMSRHTFPSFGETLAMATELGPHTYHNHQRGNTGPPTSTTSPQLRPATVLRDERHAASDYPSSPKLAALDNARDPALLNIGTVLEENDMAANTHQQSDDRSPDLLPPTWEAPLVDRYENLSGQCHVFPTLQALDHEAEPLIDHDGVSRVLERSSVISLTRSYPYQGLQPTDEVKRRREGTTPSAVATSITTTSNNSSVAPTSATTKSPAVADIPILRRSSRSNLLSHSITKLSSMIGDAASVPGTGDATGTAPRRPRSHGPNPVLPSRVSSVKPIALWQTAATCSTAPLYSPTDDEPAKSLRLKYEEFEQCPSPWAQSPAPSPAVRADPNQNPFFVSRAPVDESSFRLDDHDDTPNSDPDYAAMPPPEAIGIDNSYTVIHVPLVHVYPFVSASWPPSSVPLSSFRLDARTMKEKSSSRSRGDRDPTTSFPVAATEADAAAACDEKASITERPPPLAILSMMSPIIPYPSNIRQSLDQLAPHMASSFSLCRHHTNLEKELTVLHRKIPPKIDFSDVEFQADDSTRVILPAYPYVDGTIGSHDHSHTLNSMTSQSSDSSGSWDKTATGLFSRRPALVTSLITGTTVDSCTDPQLRSRAQLGRSNSGASPVRAKTASNERRRPSAHTTMESALDQASRRRRISGASNSAASLRFDPAGLGASTAQRQHTSLPSSGVNLTSTSQSLHPGANVPSSSDTGSGAGGTNFGAGSNSGAGAHTRSRLAGSIGGGASSLVSVSTAEPSDMTPPSDRLKGLMLDTLPAHVFVALPHTGEIVWVNSRYLSYRGQTATDLASNPWGSIYPDDLDEHVRAWKHSSRTGEQFSRTVRIRRFDGAYRWCYARAIASRDRRGVIRQFFGSYMDIHDQRTAELRAARQEEIEASEAQHRLLANLIPQIIFTATEDDGITFANEQWLSYSGQDFEDALRLGFIEFVHPDDLAKCRMPSMARVATGQSGTESPSLGGGQGSEDPKSADAAHVNTGCTKDTTLLAEAARMAPSLRIASANSEFATLSESAAADLSDLARKGIVKLSTDASGRSSYTTELRLRSSAGEYRWHLVRCVAIDAIGLGNGAGSYLGSATDINDHKLLEAKLQEAMESKSRFLSNMSHEIRTPLIGISGMVSFLQDTPLSEEQGDYANTIHTSASSLLMIINDILDLSKVDAGMMKLIHEWFHTRSLIEDVNELVSTMAISKRLELNYIVDEDVPVWVKGDKVRIRQILLNVIGNAIKFTSEGEVFSRCRVLAVGGADRPDGLGADEIMLEFAVIDTGRGFSKQEAELIFKPFSQIDSSSTRQHGGSGLGLVISRQLVELHGGRMNATAEPSKGSTFTFTARFSLPTASEHPDLLAGSFFSGIESPLPFGQRHGRVMTAAPGVTLPPLVESPAIISPTLSSTVASSASSDPSLLSLSSSHQSHPSFTSSVAAGLALFGEAAKAAGQNMAQMRLEIPSDRRDSAAKTESTAAHPHGQHGQHQQQREQYSQSQGVLVFSILIVSQQKHSREATKQHIQATLPKDSAWDIRTVGSAEEAHELLAQGWFSHVVINLPTVDEIIGIIKQVPLRRASVSSSVSVLSEGAAAEPTMVIVLCDSAQRQAVQRSLLGNANAEAGEKTGEKADGGNVNGRVAFMLKPVKPSRLAMNFDPDRLRDVSIDRSRSLAQQMVELQKASYDEIRRWVGNRAVRVLLVEDNAVNQKVLHKFLAKVGVTVEMAVDGVDCTELVLSRPHDHFDLILCDLHMPRKDGYQACREIRQWEADRGLGRLPIIALSANVMSDVREKCIAAGFSDFVTKPVDFIDLSRAMLRFFIAAGDTIGSKT